MDLSDFCYARTRGAPRQSLVRWAELRGANLRILEERPGADGGSVGGGQPGGAVGGGGKAGRTRARAVWDHVLTGAKVTPTWGRNEITIKLDADKLTMTLRNEDEFRRWRDGIAWAATTVEDYYTIVGSKQLHRGKTSEVVVGMDRSSPMSEVVAVKVINRAKAGAERAVAEMRLSVHVAHPRIVPVYDVRETLFDVFLVQQRAPGGNLYHSIQRSGLHVGLEDVRDVLGGILQALAYLHGRGVVHGAVQLTNVLLGVSPGSTCFERPEPGGGATMGGGVPSLDKEADTDAAADGPGDVTASATTAASAAASAATFAAVRAAAEAGLLGAVAPPPGSNGGAPSGSVDVPRPSLGRPDAASVAALRARSHDGWANHIKLCDLGHGAYLPRCPGGVLHRLDEALQVPYLAPEILHTPTRVAQGWGTPADLWAVGVCGFWLLTRCFPYPGTSVEAVLGGIEGGPPTAADPRLMNHLPDDGGATLSLLRQLLCVDPVKRLTAQAALQHRWFSPPASAATADGGMGLGHRLSASVSRASVGGVGGGDDDGDRGRSSSLLGGTLESGRASSVSRVSSEAAATSAVAPPVATAAASAPGWRSASTERPVAVFEGVPSMRYGRVSSLAGLGMDASEVGKASSLDGVGGKPPLSRLLKAAVTAVTAARRLRIFALMRQMEEGMLAGDPLLSSAAPEPSAYGNGSKWATAPESPPAVPVVDASFLVPDRAEVQPQEVSAPAAVSATIGNDCADGDGGAAFVVGQSSTTAGSAVARVTSTEGHGGGWVSSERASTEAALSHALSGRSSRTPSTSVAASDRGDDRADGDGGFLFSAPASGAGSRAASVSSSKGSRSRNRRSFVGLVRTASKVVENHLQAHPPQHFRTPQGYPRSASSTGGNGVAGGGGRGIYGNGPSSVSLVRESDAGITAAAAPASPRSGVGTMFQSSPNSPRGAASRSAARRGVGRSLSYARDRSATDVSSRGGRDAAAPPPSADRSSINSTASGRGTADRGSLAGRSTALVRSASTAPGAGSDVAASSGGDSPRDARPSTARASSGGVGGNGLPRNSSVRGTNEVAYGVRLPGTVIMGRTTVSRDARELLSAGGAGGADSGGGGGRDLLITRSGSAAVLTPAGAAATAAAAAGRRSSTVAAQTAATAAFEAVAAARVAGHGRPDRGRAGVGGGRTTVAGEEKVSARKGGRQASVWLKKVRAFGFGMGGGGGGGDGAT